MCCRRKAVKPWIRDWTCEDCVDIMSRVGAYMNEKDTVAEAVQLLQGPHICQGVFLALTKNSQTGVDQVLL
jgi:hypothetical protein